MRRAGGTILWQVANHRGSMKCVAYVHVATPAVDVTVDDQRYRVETMWERPIVCELRPGRHHLRMLRSGRVLFEQEFTLDPGQEVVLTAWEGFKGKPAEKLPQEFRSTRRFRDSESMEQILERPDTVVQGP